MGEKKICATDLSERDLIRQRTLHVAVEDDGERVEEQDATQLRDTADTHPALSPPEAANLREVPCPSPQR